MKKRFSTKTQIIKLSKHLIRVIKDPNYWKKIARANAATINGILWFGLLCIISILGLAFSANNENSVTIANVKVPLQLSWIPLTLFTVLHLIYTIRFEIAVRNYWSLTEPEEYSELFKDITSEGGYFMREMKPRILPENGGAAPMGNDMSTWLTHITAILLFIALWKTVKLETALDELGLLNVVVAFLLTFANWIIGSRWAIVLSELAVRKEYSTILARKSRKAKNSIPTLFDEDENGNSKK